jgi:uncharacterized protein (DUF2126 family)
MLIEGTVGVRLAPAEIACCRADFLLELTIGVAVHQALEIELRPGVRRVHDLGGELALKGTAPTPADVQSEFVSVNVIAAGAGCV